MTKQPNPWGLYDMHGSLAEWCLDTYAETLPGGSVVDRLSVGGSDRVIRGGAYNMPAPVCRSASRMMAVPTAQSLGIGLRVAAH